MYRNDDFNCNIKYLDGILVFSGERMPLLAEFLSLTGNLFIGFSTIVTRGTEHVHRVIEISLLNERCYKNFLNIKKNMKKFNIGIVIH